jgi:hypothetical protein
MYSYTAGAPTGLGVVSFWQPHVHSMFAGNVASCSSFALTQLFFD